MNYYGLMPVPAPDGRAIHFLNPANSVYANLPLPLEHSELRATLGGAVSVFCLGRADDRRNAYACLILHALRVIDSLGILHLCIPSSSATAASGASSRRQQQQQQERMTEDELRALIYDNVRIPGIRILANGDAPNFSSMSAAEIAKLTAVQWGAPSAHSTMPPIRPLDDRGRVITEESAGASGLRPLPVPVMHEEMGRRCYARSKAKVTKARSE
jgi:hypothetical protein